MTHRFAGRAVGFAKRRLLMAALPALLVICLIAGAAMLVVTLLAAQATAPQLQSETITAREASENGLDKGDLRTIKAIADQAHLPWQLLAALAVAQNGPTGRTPDAAPSTPTTPSTTPTAATTAAGWGRYLLTQESGLDQRAAEDLDTATRFVAGALLPNLIAHPGWSGADSFVVQAVMGDDGLQVDTASQTYLDRRNTVVHALAALPVQNNTEPFMSRVFDTAQSWALGRSASCATGGAPDSLGAITGGGLSTAVPEPMRSELIRAGQAAAVAPAAVAALYLTEQNGFQFMYDYYDNGRQDSAFQLTPTAARWHLDRYGTTGEWPPGGKFRGPFQFGPIWESTYRTADHPDVLKFGDAAVGAARYLADLGAAGTDLESVRAAARSYNGQVSWSIGGGIRNPDPARYSLVQDLYADQVVHLTQALADRVGADEPSTPTSSPASASATGTSAPRSDPPTPSRVASGGTGTSCVGVGGGPAGQSAGPGGITVLVNGTAVTIPDNPDVATELRGKAVMAPNPQVAAGIAWGFTQLGTPYVWGGGGLGSANPGGPDHGCNRATCLPEVGYDCSGLAWSVYRQMNPQIQLTVGNSGAMAAAGTHIPLQQAVAGDLITYGGSATHHVAVSLGYIDGTLAVLEAPQTGLNVRVIYSSSSDINDWASRYWS